jgi:hypothetical protein
MRCSLLWILLFAVCALPVFANGQRETVAPPPEETAAEEPVPPPPVREWTFERIKEKVWRLSAIKFTYSSIQLDRAAMQDAGMDEIYVLQFNEEGVNGKALSNYYFAPYAKQEGKEVAFHQIVGTLAADPDSTEAGSPSEEDYYRYLQQVTRWNVTDDHLELSTEDDSITLYYTPPSAMEAPGGGLM